MLCTATLGIVSGCSRPDPTTNRSPRSEPSASPLRIVSTVPSITEVLFDIGVGELVVGDSAFTKFPPETANIPKIGGLYDMNLEAIVSLNPDLVITLTENLPLRERLKDFDLETLVVDHRSLDGVLDSYDAIGCRLGTEIQAAALRRKAILVDKLGAFAQESATPTKPVPVLLCVDRMRGTGRIQGLFVAGNNPFYQEIIRLAGGENVAANMGLAFPSLSAEGIADLAPEIIVELYTGEGMTTISEVDLEKKKDLLDAARNDWKKLEVHVPAVKNDRIFVIADDFATIPGPRTPLLIEKLAAILKSVAETPEK